MSGFSVPASRNGVPTAVFSSNGIGANPAYHPKNSPVSPSGGAPVSSLSGVQRQQIAGSRNPVNSQATVVRPTSQRQNTTTGALLHQNAITPASGAAVANPANTSHKTVSGVQDIHGMSALHVSLARGTAPGGFKNLAGATAAGSPIPRILRSTRTR